MPKASYRLKINIVNLYSTGFIPMEIYSIAFETRMQNNEGLA